MSEVPLIWDIPPEAYASFQGRIIQDENQFLDDLEAFHRQRGTPFDRHAELRVAQRPISLHNLYMTVMARGGYDPLVGERLGLRQLIKHLGVPEKSEGQVTFGLKSIYYKNLAAYEIARFWNEEPPPREILEDLTAKGGDLRHRKIENYVRNSNTGSVDGGNDSDDEGVQTPQRDRMAVDDPTSAGRYPTRQLRQDPKRTQLYQPESTPQRTRYVRGDSPHVQTPAIMQPQYSQPAVDPRNPNFTVDKYEPRQPIALTLRPVITPGNDPNVFYQRKALEKAQSMPRIPPDPRWLDQLRYSLNGGLFTGPSIYTRCHLGLLSGIKQEEDFALHHLVKVSYERGDKFTFTGFPALAESLVAKCLQISALVYNLDWKITYNQGAGVVEAGSLNACFGTSRLREMVIALQAGAEELNLESADAIEKLERLNEAALIIRNMITLESNAAFIAQQALFKDLLIIMINLPCWARLTELRQYGLEMAEQTTRYWVLRSDDPLYQSLVAELGSKDRGRLLSTLRAISRIGIETEHTFKVEHIPEETLERLLAFLLLDDDELVESTLDVLYEITAIPSNITNSLERDISLLPSIVPRLQEFLLHNALPVTEKIQNRAHPSTAQLPPTIPIVPHELYVALLQYPEPERSSRWLRCCFQESPEDDITQIAIWQAYQARFHSHGPTPGQIQAADFIKNVSNTFSQAQAQVLNVQPQPRFIIKGIKPRRILVDMQGRPFYKCLWEITQNSHNAQPVYDDRGAQRYICGAWADKRQSLWNHVLQSHLGLRPDPNTGKFESNPTTNAAVAEKKCAWIGCARQAPITNAKDLALHIRGHIPESTDTMSRIIEDLATTPHPGQLGRPGAKGRSLAGGDPEMYTRHTFYHTVIDERGFPAGIPFMAVMILRNLARYVDRYGAKFSAPGYLPRRGSSEHEIETEKKQRLMGRFFNDGVRAELWHDIFVHRTLGSLVQELMAMIEKGEQGQKKVAVEQDAETNGRDDPEAQGSNGWDSTMEV